MPPLNGFPLNVPRNTEYGFADDATNQDVISLMATVDHSFNKDFRLRNQTMFNFVNTNVRETAGQAVGTLTANGGFMPAANGPTGTPFSGVPLNQLYIRQQSHDRNIYDFTIDNQSELTARFDTGPSATPSCSAPSSPTRATGTRTSTAHGTCTGVPLQTPATTGYAGCVPAGFTTGSSSPATSLRSTATWRRPRPTPPPATSTTPSRCCRGSSSSVACATTTTTHRSATRTIPPTSSAAPRFPIGAGHHLLQQRRAGAIIEPTREQSYYFSYSTSFNPSLEQLVATTGTSQPLPPEQNEAYEAGAKYELLNGNLSLNAALFQITKTNARSQNPDGTFSATGTVRVKGVTRPASPAASRPSGRCSAATPTSMAASSTASARARRATCRSTRRGTRPTLWTTYTFKETYEIGGGPTYIGYRYANNTNSVSVPDFVRLRHDCGISASRPTTCA